MALAELNQAIDRCPTLMQARVDRARALIRLGKHVDALPDLQLAVAEKSEGAYDSPSFSRRYTERKARQPTHSKRCKLTAAYNEKRVRLSLGQASGAQRHQERC